MTSKTNAVKAAEQNRLDFTFDDESVVSFTLDQVDEATLRRLAYHGASQKIGDSYAGAADADDPLAYAKASVEQVIAQLYAGDWRTAAVGGPRVTDLATALARATGKSLEAAVEAIDAMDDGQKKALRKHPKVAVALAQITAERAAKRAEGLAEAAEKAGALPI